MIFLFFSFFNDKIIQEAEQWFYNVFVKYDPEPSHFGNNIDKEQYGSRKNPALIAEMSQMIWLTKKSRNSHHVIMWYSQIFNFCFRQLHAKLERNGLSDFKLRWIETDGQVFHKEQKRKKEEGRFVSLKHLK